MKRESDTDNSTGKKVKQENKETDLLPNADFSLFNGKTIVSVKEEEDPDDDMNFIFSFEFQDKTSLKLVVVDNFGVEIRQDLI
jgi:hypothetical protein